jgi:heme/copper-type cytochrome/quinol oxidase subunit 4
MTTRQTFIRPAQQFVSFALSALFTVVIFASVSQLAAEPAPDALLARVAAPAAAHVHG